MPEPKTLPRWAMLAVLLFGGLLMAIQQTLVIPLLPHFTEILGASRNDVSWLVTLTLLTGCVSVPIITRMADMYGKKRMLIITVSFTMVGAIVAVTAPLLPILLIGRGMQGLGMALIPIGIAIMRERFPPRTLAPSLAMLSATMGVGGALGLPLVGWLFVSFGWKSAFLVVASLGAILITLAIFIIPESPVRSGGRFDILGAILLAISVAALLVVVSKGGEFGWLSTPTITLLCTALVVGAVWLWTQTRVRNPLVDLRTLRNRPVMLTNVYSLMLGFGMMSNTLLVSYQLQMPLDSGYGHGLNAFSAALAMLPGGLVSAAISPIGGLLINRVGSRTMLIVGASVVACGFISLSTWHSSVAAIIIGSCTLSAGTALAFAAQPTIIMKNMPLGEVAAANGINSLLRSLGLTMASAVTGGMLVAFAFPAVNGAEPVPTWTGFGLTYGIAIAGSLFAVILAISIPRSADTVRFTRATRGA